MSAKPLGSRCSPRSIASRISRKRSNVSLLQLNGTTYRSKIGNDLLTKHASGRDLVDQDFGTARFRIDPSALECRLRELQKPPAALVLIQEEIRINVET